MQRSNSLIAMSMGAAIALHWHTPALSQLSPIEPPSSGTATLPETLLQHPNPLQRPTQPQEVELRQVQPLTLQQALDLARRQNQELQIAELELERSRAALQEARAAELPTVDAGADLTFQEAQPIGFGTTNGSIDTVLGGRLEVGYGLLTGGRRSAQIQAAERQVRFNQLEVERLNEQIRLTIIGEYYDLLEADAQVEIFAAALEEAEQSLRVAEARERAGVGTRFDVLQNQVQVANRRQELIQAINQQLVNRRRLARRLNLPPTVEITAADPVVPSGEWELPLEESIVLALRHRSELEQQLVRREVSILQQQAALAATRPQVNLFANYSLRNVLNQDQGFTDNYAVGARLNWRLFDGGAARAAANQRVAEQAIAETQFADTRNQVRLQVEEAFLTLQANQENIATANLAVEQAEQALRLARLRFEAGVGTQLDVITAQTELTRARSNQVRAIVGYNRSLASLQRAVSNWPDGFLFDVP